MIWVLQGNLILVRSGANVERFSPNSPIGVGVFITFESSDPEVYRLIGSFRDSPVGNIIQIINVGVEIPVSSNVIKGVVLKH